MPGPIKQASLSQCPRVRNHSSCRASEPYGCRKRRVRAPAAGARFAGPHEPLEIPLSALDGPGASANWHGTCGFAKDVEVNTTVLVTNPELPRSCARHEGGERSGERSQPGQSWDSASGSGSGRQQWSWTAAATKSLRGEESRINREGQERPGTAEDADVASSQDTTCAQSSLSVTRSDAGWSGAASVSEVPLLGRWVYSHRGEVGPSGSSAIDGRATLAWRAEKGARGLHAARLRLSHDHRAVREVEWAADVALPGCQQSSMPLLSDQDGANERIAQTRTAQAHVGVAARNDTAGAGSWGVRVVHGRLRAGSSERIQWEARTRWESGAGTSLHAGVTGQVLRGPWGRTRVSVDCRPALGRVRTRLVLGSEARGATATWGGQEGLRLAARWRCGIGHDFDGTLERAWGAVGCKWDRSRGLAWQVWGYVPIG